MREEQTTKRFKRCMVMNSTKHELKGASGISSQMQEDIHSKSLLTNGMTSNNSVGICVRLKQWMALTKYLAT